MESTISKCLSYQPGNCLYGLRKQRVPHDDSRCESRDLNTGRAKYEARFQTTRPRHSILLNQIVNIQVKDRAIAQAVSRWLPTAAARIQNRV
jgi:hypothetical protein